MRKFSVGGKVEYYSTSQGGWIPAKVLGFDQESGTYQLDIHSAAPAQKVRAAIAGKSVPEQSGGYSEEQKPQFLVGDAVEYFSASQGGWVPAMVKGFDRGENAYVLDIQPVAVISKVRAASNSSVANASGSGSRCGICQAVGELSGADCGHLFCSQCLQKHVGRMDFIKDQVPCPRCKSKFSQAQVKRIVGSGAYKNMQEKMERRDAELAQKLANAGDICLSCGKESHEGFTCEQHARRVLACERENKKADKRFEQLMANLQLRCCPKCGTASERGAGSCYFMQCRSTVCKKRTYWCYICGLQLTLDDHYTHYPKGPYEPKCFTPESKHVPIVGAGKVEDKAMGVRERPRESASKDSSDAKQQQNGVDCASFL